MAGGDFAAGAQLFENYGQPNHIYFLYHGFVLQPENRHDCAHLELALLSSSLSAAAKAKASFLLEVRTVFCLSAPVVTCFSQALHLNPEAASWSREFCVSRSLEAPRALWLFVALMVGLTAS